MELIALHLDHDGNRPGIPTSKPAPQANSTEFTSAKTPLWVSLLISRPRVVANSDGRGILEGRHAG